MTKTASSCGGSGVKALIVEPAGNLWGSERALLDLIDCAHGLEIAVCCPPNSPFEHELKKRGVLCYPYFIGNLHRKSRLRRLQAAVGVLRACAKFGPDVIHLNQAGAYRVTLLAAKFYDIPIVSHVRILEDASYLAQAASGSQRLAAIIAISGAVEKEIRSHPTLAHIPVRTIYDAYARKPGAKTPPRKRPRIICVGRLTPVKGQDLLLDALSSPAGYPAQLDCMIVGDGDVTYVQGLKSRQSKAGVKVIWTGFLENVHDLLQGSSILAVPSHQEPLGRVIFEAWDAGALPIVYSGSGGAAEVVAASGGGILYEDQTPASLSGALKGALALDELELDRAIEQGRAWLNLNCSSVAYGRAISEVFQSAILRGPYVASAGRGTAASESSS